MELRIFEFKYSGYFYNEEVCDSLVRAFDLTTEEYKNMTEEEQQKFYEEKFYEECRLSLIGVLVKKLKSVNALYTTTDQGRDALMLMVCRTLPYEVYPNVMEWINDDEISEINYNGLSIKEMVKNMNFPEYDDYKKAVPELTKEKYEEQRARCYLRVFSYMATYAKYDMKNPLPWLTQALCTFRTI